MRLSSDEKDTHKLVGSLCDFPTTGVQEKVSLVLARYRQVPSGLGGDDVFPDC